MLELDFYADNFLYIYVYTNLSTCPLVYIFVHHPFYASDSPSSFHQSVYLSTILSTCSPVCIHVYQSVYVSISLPSCLLVCVCVHLSVYRSTSRSYCQSNNDNMLISLSTCSAVCHHVYPSVIEFCFVVLSDCQNLPRVHK